MAQFQGFRRSNVVVAVAAQYGFLALPQYGRMAFFEQQNALACHPL